MKRLPADDAYSKVIRLSNDWNCHYCKRNFEHDKGKLHCSHVFGRRAYRVRWSIDPNNAMAHCISCHRKLGEHPVLFTDHYIETYGQDALDRLRERYNDLSVKYSKAQQKQIAAHFRQEYGRINKLRCEGQQGVIEIKSYD